MTDSTHQAELRQTARRLLSSRSTSAAIRAAMSSSTGTDDGLWSELVAQGWAGIAVPEELGGVGLGWSEAAILFEEAGRHLLCAPLLSTTLAILALLEGGSEEQQREWLPKLVTGTSRATVALPHTLEPSPLALTDGAVHGTAPLVVDGQRAELVVVPGRDEDGRHAAVLVQSDDRGVIATAAETMDLTRPMADLDFEAALVVGVLPGVGVFDRIRTGATVLLANEQVGVAARVMDEAAEHARTRLQFGRPIGSFQAIKHRLAEMLVRLEAARSVARHAAESLAARDMDELALAAPMAASLCAEVACQLTGDSIQVHGGIGFTWEHDAHLAFKRAEATRHLFGAPEAHRTLLANRLGLRQAG